MNVVEEAAITEWIESVLNLLRQEGFIYGKDLMNLFRACNYKLFDYDPKYKNALRARILASSRALNLETDNKENTIKVLERMLNEYEYD